MKPKIGNSATSKGAVTNRTVVSSVDKGNSWTGAIINASGTKRRVTVNSLNGLFSRSQKFKVLDEKA